MEIQTVAKLAGSLFGVDGVFAKIYPPFEPLDCGWRGVSGREFCFLIRNPGLGYECVSVCLFAERERENERKGQHKRTFRPLNAGIPPKKIPGSILSLTGDPLVGVQSFFFLLTVCMDPHTHTHTPMHVATCVEVNL